MPRLAAVLLLACALSAAAQEYKESITVARILLDVRVTEAGGEPITDLTAEDFRVRLGGKAARVESVTWIPETGPSPLTPLPASGERGEKLVERRTGRLFVVFVQTDFARNRVRTEGQMNFLRYADDWANTLEPEDRVCVFSFDSHLKFRLDFTGEKERIVGAITEALYIDHPEFPPPAGDPSIIPRLDHAAMKRAATSEAGLRIVGAALRSLPGPKSLLLMGWGLGEMTPHAVRMRPEWTQARRELEAARVSIFSLDTTYADYHTLEAGLQLAAEATGGFYAKTHLFPSIAIERLQKTLIGRYELELRRPEGLSPGTHELIVRVSRRGARVLAPMSWMDRP